MRVATDSNRWSKIRLHPLVEQDDLVKQMKEKITVVRNQTNKDNYEAVVDSETKDDDRDGHGNESEDFMVNHLKDKITVANVEDEDGDIVDEYDRQRYLGLLNEGREDAQPKCNADQQAVQDDIRDADASKNEVSQEENREDIKPAPSNTSISTAGMVKKTNAELERVKKEREEMSERVKRLELAKLSLEEQVDKATSEAAVLKTEKDVASKRVLEVEKEREALRSRLTQIEISRADEGSPKVSSNENSFQATIDAALNEAENEAREKLKRHKKVMKAEEQQTQDVVQPGSTTTKTNPKSDDHRTDETKTKSGDASRSKDTSLASVLVERKLAAVTEKVVLTNKKKSAGAATTLFPTTSENNNAVPASRCSKTSERKKKKPWRRLKRFFGKCRKNKKSTYTSSASNKHQKDGVGKVNITRYEVEGFETVVLLDADAKSPSSKVQERDGEDPPGKHMKRKESMRMSEKKKKNMDKSIIKTTIEEDERPGAFEETKTSTPEQRTKRSKPLNGSFTNEAFSTTKSAVSQSFEKTSCEASNRSIQKEPAVTKDAENGDPNKNELNTSEDSESEKQSIFEKTLNLIGFSNQNMNYSEPSNGSFAIEEVSCKPATPQAFEKTSVKSHTGSIQKEVAATKDTECTESGTHDCTLFNGSTEEADLDATKDSKIATPGSKLNESVSNCSTSNECTEKEPEATMDSQSVTPSTATRDSKNTAHSKSATPSGTFDKTNDDKVKTSPGKDVDGEKPNGPVNDEEFRANDTAMATPSVPNNSNCSKSNAPADKGPELAQGIECTFENQHFNCAEEDEFVTKDATIAAPNNAFNISFSKSIASADSMLEITKDAQYASPFDSEELGGCSAPTGLLDYVFGGFQVFSCGNAKSPTKQSTTVNQYNESAIYKRLKCNSLACTEPISGPDRIDLDESIEVPDLNRERSLLDAESGFYSCTQALADKEQQQRKSTVKCIFGKWQGDQVNTKSDEKGKKSQTERKTGGRPRSIRIMNS